MPHAVPAELQQIAYVLQVRGLAQIVGCKPVGTDIAVARRLVQFGLRGTVGQVLGLRRLREQRGAAKQEKQQQQYETAHTRALRNLRSDDASYRRSGAAGWQLLQQCKVVQVVTGGDLHQGPERDRACMGMDRGPRLLLRRQGLYSAPGSNRGECARFEGRSRRYSPCQRRPAPTDPDRKTAAPGCLRHRCGAGAMPTPLRNRPGGTSVRAGSTSRARAPRRWPQKFAARTPPPGARRVDRITSAASRPCSRCT